MRTRHFFANKYVHTQFNQILNHKFTYHFKIEDAKSSVLLGARLKVVQTFQFELHLHDPLTCVPWVIIIIFLTNKCVHVSICISISIIYMNYCWKSHVFVAVLFIFWVLCGFVLFRVLKR